MFYPPQSLHCSLLNPYSPQSKSFPHGKAHPEQLVKENFVPLPPSSLQTSLEHASCTTGEVLRAWQRVTSCWHNKTGSSTLPVFCLTRQVISLLIWGQCIT